MNHVPYNAFNGWSAGINGEVGASRQPAAYHFVAFLMNDKNKVEAVVNAPDGRMEKGRKVRV